MFENQTTLFVRFLFFVMVLILLTASPGFAEELEIIDEDIEQSSGSVTISEGTAVNGNVTLNMGDLEVNGLVNGNVQNNMGRIVINGDVQGDVSTDMGQLEINGSVSGDVRTRMGDVEVTGSVDGNIYSDLGRIQVDGNVGGNVKSGFGELDIGGVVAGDVDNKGGDITITGLVEGDVTLDQGQVEVGPEGSVNGHIYVDRGLIKKADTAAVGSMEIGEELTRSELREEMKDDYADERPRERMSERIADLVITRVNDVMRRVSFLPQIGPGKDWELFPTLFVGFYSNITRSLLNMLILFALAALTHSLFPRPVKAVGDAISLNAGPVIGWGLLTTILVIPVMILLGLSIIGIPLILVVLMVLAVAAILGYTAITGFVGGRLIYVASPSSRVNPLGTIAIGVLVIGLVSMIPIVGWLVSWFIYALAIGASLVTRFGTQGSN
ncbi:MAG: polymer-forming cytoskeletal protein [Bacillota bacterium]